MRTVLKKPERGLSDAEPLYEASCPLCMYGRGSSLLTACLDTHHLTSSGFAKGTTNDRQRRDPRIQQPADPAPENLRRWFTGLSHRGGGSPPGQSSAVKQAYKGAPPVVRATPRRSFHQVPLATLPGGFGLTDDRLVCPDHSTLGRDGATWPCLDT
jgi:hypothetical protein